MLIQTYKIVNDVLEKEWSPGGLEIEKLSPLVQQKHAKMWKEVTTWIKLSVEDYGNKLLLTTLRGMV